MPLIRDEFHRFRHDIAMAAYYLWLKGLHVVFMVTWFAGLFYLPRLFIYHTTATDSASRDRFTVMEVRLFAIMTIGAIVTAVMGAWLLLINPGLLDMGWFRTKLALLAGLFAYHYRCYAWITRLRTASPTQDTQWLRWFNEIPTVFLIAIILLAVVKPY
jgi:putative membrane protein